MPEARNFRMAAYSDLGIFVLVGTAIVYADFHAVSTMGFGDRQARKLIVDKPGELEYS